MRRLDLRIRTLWAILLLAAGAAACADAPPPPPSEAELLVQHLESTGGYDVHGGFIITATDVRTNLVTGASQLVVDIRAPEDFAAGHVEGAVNVPLTGLADYMAQLSPAASTYGDIVLICYSGQSAAYAAGVLRAMGYHNARSMKWGMAAWHEDFAGGWVRNRANARATEWIDEPSPAPTATYELPALTTGLSTGEGILGVRARTVLAEGFGPAAISNADVFANPAAFFTVNLWPSELYQNTGHVPGAVNLDPAADPFLSTTQLHTLPTDQPVVLYCWTGQSSAYMAGYLRVLGYDARSLMFGTNGMIYDRMVADEVGNAFDPERDVMNYSYVQ
jgi:rhodanese-related sulfurtransferase